MSQRTRVNLNELVAWRVVIANVAAVLALLGAGAGRPARAAESVQAQAPANAEEDHPAATAADAQNPIAHLISIPLQDNIYTNVGPYSRTANTLLLQPVIPFALNADWSLITRTIIPIAHQPALGLQQGATTGLGNIEPQFYFTPAHPGKFIWGAGAQLWLPTASNVELGYNRFGGGPTFVGLTVEGHWVAGALLNNVWAGSGPRRVNLFTFNPFVNYNMQGGWYLASTPVITSNWVKPSSDRWTIPLGGGFGRVFVAGGLHLNARLEAFRDVRRPNYAPQTQVQFQLQMLFPEKRS